VPDDIAIIGIDDIEEGRYARPTLSTVSLDTPFIAEHAIARIAARIDDPSLPAEEIVAPHLLLPRESTGALDDRRDPTIANVGKLMTP
jgi:DNA-binding LacI/PurR family transcriptional regulator